MDTFTFHPPPAFVLEGAGLYAMLAVVASMFFGRRGGMILLGLLAAGLGPLALSVVPQLALAVGLLVLWLIVRRYGWRWCLATCSYAGMVGYLALDNIAELGGWWQLAPPAWIPAILDAIIAGTLLWFLAVAAWLVLTIAGGRFVVLFRSGLAGESARRGQQAEIKATRQLRTTTGHKALSWATGGRYKTPAQRQQQAQAVAAQAKAARKARKGPGASQRQARWRRTRQRPAPASVRHRARARQRAGAAGRVRP